MTLSTDFYLYRKLFYFLQEEKSIPLDVLLSALDQDIPKAKGPVLRQDLSLCMQIAKSISGI